MTEKKSPEIRKNEILGAAVSLFLERGYEGTSMEAIARKACLTKGGLYHHFSSKEEILIEANNLFTEPVLVMLQKLKNAPDPVKGLKTYIASYLGYWKKHKEAVAFTFLSMVKMLQRDELKPVMARYGEMVTSIIEEQYIRAVDLAVMKPHNTRGAALCLSAALDGFMAYMLTDAGLQNRKNIDLFYSQFVEIYLIKGEKNV